MSVPRLRMFAGPNGSGKSTIKGVVPPELLGVYLNPDEMQKEVVARGFLDVRAYGVETTREEILPFFINSTLLDKPALVAEARTAIEFTFPAAIGKNYRIEASTDLAAWEIVETGIAGTGGQVQRFYSTRGQPTRYFRVEEVAPRT